jgi:hypothetical protein
LILRVSAFWTSFDIRHLILVILDSPCAPCRRGEFAT